MTPLFRKKLTERAAAELYVSSLLSATRRLWPQLQRDLREIDLGGTMQRCDDPDLPPVNLAMCVFAMELSALVNLFPSEQSHRIRERAFDALAQALATWDRSPRTKGEFPSRLQARLTQLETDLTMWVEARHFQMIGNVAWECLGLKKGLTSPDPYVAILLGQSLTAFGGGWKKIRDTYKLMA